MAKSDLTFEGEVTDSYPNAMFKVKLRMEGATSEAEVLCTICGKIRQNQIRIIPGDTVLVELSEYDLKKGRIIRRQR